MRKALASLILLAAGIALWAAVDFVRFASSPRRAGAAESQVFEVARGQAPRAIARRLRESGAIDDEFRLYWLGKLRGDWAALKAGEYRVGPAMTPLEILATLRSGVSIPRPLTVREGENLWEVAAQIQARGFGEAARVLELARSAEFIASLGFENPPPATLEGYLFPETYHFDRTTPVEAVLRQMVRKFRDVWTTAHDSRAREQGFTRHQAVTLASMIEKETGAAHERALISSVFHNRLRKRMRLQSDPTTIYGIWENYGGNLRRQDLLNPTPWNTYAIPALPVGPIGNPGREAIEAALNPATSEYLYFVSYNDGTHAFSRTYEEHAAWVKRLQLDPKAREGRSWRDQYRREQAAKQGTQRGSGSPRPAN